jgi:peptidoglycan/LPS O-acetylase OafA/YrhL
MQQRIHFLDSARGIAALMVVIFHFSDGYGEHRLLSETGKNIVAFFINGSDAVSFFFVLSGFVLSYPYFTNNTSPDYLRFIVSRLFRLYPAFWFMLIAMSIYYGCTGFAHSWTDYVKEASLYQNFTPLLGQAWSLNIELVLSCLMPILIVAAQNNIRYMYFLLPISLLFHAFINPFLFHFILGIILAHWFAKSPEKLHHIYSRLKTNVIIAIPMLYLAFSMRHLSKLVYPNPSIGFQTFWDYTGIDFSILSAIAAFFFLLILLKSARLQKALQTRTLLFLGKISYSLYICHWFFLHNILSKSHTPLQNVLHTNPITTILVNGVLYLILSFLLATFMYYCIEKPFIKWGKALYQQFSVQDNS